MNALPLSRNKQMTKPHLPIEPFTQLCIAVSPIFRKLPTRPRCCGRKIRRRGGRRMTRGARSRALCGSGRFIQVERTEKKCRNCLMARCASFVIRWYPPARRPRNDVEERGDISRTWASEGSPNRDSYNILRTVLLFLQTTTTTHYNDSDNTKTWPESDDMIC